MAQFLYKLGLAAYDNRKKFIAAWIAILVLIGVLAGLFMGKLSNTFTLPGTETQRVLALMDEELPELSGGNGTIVFQTEDGSEFTDAQTQAISKALDTLDAQEPVRSIINPFDTQEQLDSSVQELEDGKTEIADNEQKLADGQTELTEGAQKLVDAEQELADGEKEIATNETMLADGRKQLEAGKQELAAAETQLAAAQKQLADGEAELASGKKELAAGEKQYNTGKQELASGEKQIAAAQKQLAAGKKELAAGKKQFDTGIKQAAAELGTSGEKATIAAAKTMLKEIAVGLKQLPSAEKLEAAIAQLEEYGLQETEDYANAVYALETRSLLEASQAQLEQLVAASTELAAATAELEAGEKTLAKESAKLEAGKKELDAAAKKLAAARTQIAQGERELANGRAQYNAGRAQLEAGKAEIAANEAKLAEGEKALADGKKQIVDGKAELEDGKLELEDAKVQLEDGQQQLEDGKVELARGERTLALTTPMRFVNEDNNTSIAQVIFYGQTESLTADQREDVKAIAEGPEAAGVKTLFSKEILSDLNSIFGPTEAIGIVIAGIVLLIMLGTFIAAGLPLLMAILGVALGVGGTLAFSSLVDMQSITPALALMLGLAVGIDYSLFIVHRHRTQLLAGMDMRKSVGRSIGTSGNAVVFAGLTVIIALSALVVSGLPFIAILGLSAAFTVLMSVLLSITLMPAILAVIGERLLTKKNRARRAEAIAAATAAGTTHASVATTASARKSPSLWWVSTLTKKPMLTTIASIVVLGVIALPATKLLTALPDGGSEPYGSDAQQAFEITSNEFGPGYTGQLIVMAELPEVSTQAEADDKLLDVAEQLAMVDGVFAAIPAMTNEDLTYGAIQVVPTTGPAAPETEAVVHELRDMSQELLADTGVTTSVTGQVAAQIDVSEKINEAVPPYLVIVVGLSLVLLLLVFRSIVVPLIATLGFLLSLAAAFGATVAVYQWGWLGSIFDVHNPAPIMSFLPILLTGILFGLAMDYQVFLVTAIREAYAHGSDPRKAVKEGFNLAAPVVVAAALIMVSVFASFVFAHLTMIRPIGFALAAGVLFDAFIVRMTLTPAVMHLLGARAWYLPKWLDRILPDVDVEGAKLADEDAEQDLPGAFETTDENVDTFFAGSDSERN